MKTKAGLLIKSPPQRERGRKIKTALLKLMAGLQSRVWRKREGDEDNDDENSGRSSKCLFHERGRKTETGSSSH